MAKDEMKIVLSSTNKAKKKAVEEIISKYYPEACLECVDVDSGVSKTPDTDEEGIDGCINRIQKAKDQIGNADGYIGLEGIITKNKYGTFICGWCVIELNSNMGFGCSAKVKIPKFIAEKITTFGELSSLVKAKYPSKLVEEIDVIGTNGIITNKGYTRVNEFVDALECAIGFISNPSNLK
ncbi:MAG: inosine/xanthosine triphosphatase [Candidatus Dojkabacteria bacterium]|nr:inosine/xanthosine triphosphatase [Candidatus Dojkabacteria bacterium]MDQ7021860.1 inosine/xanthosine triphosphatase [Candidatus Dojkabacteria bacterium]